MARDSGHQPGGGIASNKITERSVRTGTGSRGTRAAGTAQIGVMWGDKATHGEPSGYTGERLHNDKSFQLTKFGNEIAANTVCGVGGSRTIYASGSQSGGAGHGAANPGSPRPNPRREAVEGE